jgi:hypothetical protein
MKSIGTLPRLLLILVISALALTTLDYAPRPALAKTLIEQPDRQTEGDPEDWTQAPKRVSPSVTRPPTEPTKGTSRQPTVLALRQILLLVLRSFQR